MGINHLDVMSRVIGSLLETTEFVLLIDGGGTRLNNNGTLSNIDLTMVPFELVTHFE